MNEGFYKRRRGVVEHIEAGTIDLLENGIHDYLSLKANLVIGNGYALPAGIVSTSAPALRSYCKRVSERTLQRILNHLERIGWLKLWKNPNGKHGNYLALICRASVHDLSGNEYRVSGEKTTDWRHPVYEPVGELSGSCPEVVRNLSGLRELREENREKRRDKKPSDSDLSVADGFEQFWTAFPKKVDKPAAVRAWRKVRPEESQAILARVELNKIGEWQGKEKRFIPNPATWLNGRRWQDEILSGGSNGKPKVSADQRTHENLIAAGLKADTVN